MLELQSNCGTCLLMWLMCFFSKYIHTICSLSQSSLLALRRVIIIDVMSIIIIIVNDSEIDL